MTVIASYHIRGGFRCDADDSDDPRDRGLSLGTSARASCVVGATKISGILINQSGMLSSIDDSLPKSVSICFLIRVLGKRAMQCYSSGALVMMTILPARTDDDEDDDADAHHRTSR
jgi:hypothetical protein